MTPPSQLAGSPPPPSLSQGSSEWLSEHLHRVNERIVERAAKLAERDNRTNIEPRDVAEAVKTFAPGVEVPDKTSVSFVTRILSWSPSITTVSAVLAIVFAGIGVFALRTGKDATSLFDIAKLLAGAIVGAAGATAKNKL